MRALAWLASSLMLMLLIAGIALVVAFVLGGGSLVGVVAGSTLIFFSWHGLRRVAPRPEGDRPPEGWLAASVGVATYAGILLLVQWNPWMLLALVVFPLWRRFIRR